MNKITFEQFLEINCYVVDIEDDTTRLERYKSWWEDGKTLIEILSFEEMEPTERLRTVLYSKLVGDKTAHEFACCCAERALSYINNLNPKSIAAIEAKRAWLLGELSDEELEKAKMAASSAEEDAEQSEILSIVKSIDLGVLYDTEREYQKILYTTEDLYNAVLYTTQAAYFAAYNAARWDAEVAASHAAYCAAEAAMHGPVRIVARPGARGEVTIPRDLAERQWQVDQLRDMIVDNSVTDNYSSPTSYFGEYAGENSAKYKDGNEVRSMMQKYFDGVLAHAASYGSVRVNKPQIGNDFPYRCTRYYEAEDLLLNTRRGIVSLVGVRGTGKTVIMHQLWSKVHTNRSYFITANPTISVNSVKTSVLDKNVDYLFINEVTELQNFINDIQDFLDFCFARGTKVVLSSTASFLLYRTLRMQAAGRSFVVNCTPFCFEDVYNIHGSSTTFQDYYENGLTIGDQKDPGNLNIAVSFYRSVNSRVRISDILEDNYTAYYYFLVSSIIGMLDGTIEVPTILDTLFNINEFELLAESTHRKRNIIRELYELFKEMNLIDVLNRHILSEDGKEIKDWLRLYYLSVPSMYTEYRDRMAVEDKNRCLFYMNKVSLFKAVAISSILCGLKKYKNWTAYSIKSESGSFEIDMCIKTRTENKEGASLYHMTLLEFKHNSSESGSHFNNEGVLNHCSICSDVTSYTIYEIGEPRPDKVKIEDFLFNVVDYIPTLDKTIPY